MGGVDELTGGQTGGHTDIRSTGWIARLPRSWRPYALLARLDRPIGAWLLFWPGAWGILLARAPIRRTVVLLILFGVGSVVMRAAGCVVNDMWDRDLDRRVTRTAGRPLASGALRMRQAAMFLAVLLAIGLAILLTLPKLAWALGAGSLVLVALYPLAKRVTWWPQLMLGFTFGWGAPMGYASAAGHLDWNAGLLYAAAICWILGYDTIYAHQDRDDDALIGVRSTARLFAKTSRPFVAVCYAAALALLLTAAFRAGLWQWPLIALVAPLALLARQVVTLDVDDPAWCLKLFRDNRDVGLWVAVALWLAR